MNKLFLTIKNLEIGKLVAGAIIGISVTVGLLVGAVSVKAATIATFSPAIINVSAGQYFNVIVSVNPQGTNNYAEKLEINFPANELEVSSFTLGNNWVALSQTGYDNTDNTNGILVKTAGYPSGFSSATTFGTITFYAKKAGNGVIKIGNNSQAFEINSQSAISGNPVTVTVIAEAPVIKTVPKATVTSKATVIPKVSQTDVVGPKIIASSSTVSTKDASSTQLAAASEAGSVGRTWAWVLLLILVAVLAFVGGYKYARANTDVGHL